MELILPQWPAPGRVRAASTTRIGGLSPAPYDTLNLAKHVGDDPGRVDANRARLDEALSLPGEPLWLNQVHGCEVADTETAEPGCSADAALARGPGRVCAVMTADCLPVLFCARDGSTVAAAHAGWRGLAAGVLERTVADLGVAPADVLAWLGPAIGPDAFEVGPEVREAFTAGDAGARGCFRPAGGDTWLADIFGLARRRLAAVGVSAVFGGGLCTYSDPRRFYSYRRDGVTGRMASLIWLAEEDPAS